MTSLETRRAGLPGPALDLAEIADRATILADGARAQSVLWL